MHLRLYYPNEIKQLVRKAGLKIKKMKVLTRYCFPFNHNILYFGKQFYTKLSVPKSVVKTMEKFDWQKMVKEKAKFNPIRTAFRVFEMIDKLDNHQIKLSESSMGVFLLCEK